MHGFITEFKTFALRGNVVDLAIAFVIGAAFGKIVSSLVDNIMMPLISLFLGVVNLSHLVLGVGGSVIRYGIFLQSIVDFLCIAFGVFLMVKLLNNLKRTQEAEPEKSAKPTEEILLLREIRTLLKKPM